MHTNRKFLLAITALTLSLPLAAAKLDIKPGKWGMTNTVTMPMSPQPMQQYNEECISEGFDPVAEMKEQMAQMGSQCSINNADETATSLKAAVSCSVPGAGDMNGEFSFVINGDTASGETVINMTMSGMTMQITSSSEAKYLGDCD